MTDLIKTNEQNRQPHVFVVSELLSEIKRLLETSYREIWLEGELSSLSQPASGHVYFSLKDDKAQIRCAMFRGRASISQYKPKEGDRVKVRVKVTVYEARGDMQLLVQHMEAAGEGLLKRRFEELKQALLEQGLFNQAHKKSLPAFPKQVGIITSASGAAVKDIITTFKRRCRGIPLLIYPAVVQGDSAPKSLLQALNNAIQHAQCDVLIITRGGGSLEDLWCFNNEELARAIHQCPIPIVSAVGHEIDFTICDFVSDLRAPTPTAAAEILSPDTQQLNQQLTTLFQRLQNSTLRKNQKHAQQVDWLYKRLVHPKQSIQNKINKLGQFKTRLSSNVAQRLKTEKNKINQFITLLQSNNPRRKLVLQKEQTQQLSRRLQQSQKNRFSNKQIQYKNIGLRLNTVSPLATLDRGFSIVRNNQESIIRSATDIKSKEKLHIRFAKGAADCEVINIHTDTDSV